MAVPDGLSSSLDWYIRIPGHILGVSNKLLAPQKDGLSTTAVEIEIEKVPCPGPSSMSFTLAIYSSNLDAALDRSIGNKSADIFSKVTSKGRSISVAIVNPKHVDGLASLISKSAVDAIDSAYVIAAGKPRVNRTSARKR